MKYGMNMLLWTADVTEEHFPLIEQIKSWGYDGIELPLFDLSEEKFKAVGKQLEALEMGCTAVTVCTAETNPISPDAAIREAAVNHLKKAIDMCAIAGATHLCGPIHSALGEFSGAGPTEEEWNYGKETLAKVADYAQSQNIMLAMEYLNRFECYFLNCAEDCARFVREVDHPHLRMMYDTFHANIEEKNIAHAIETCSDVCVHVHISENDRSTPGEGNVDWKTNFNTLKETGYDGWMTIEAFGLAMPDLAAATKIWRRMYSTEEHLAIKGLQFMREKS
ncbi:D-tagatose 3-epimerase [hydrothermal vent metagenome]|uniref:D-tagatose 3-epimerase n=1 Tax=hydrothermal vent metagenome TaxID=652676 RepID=A0A3B1CYQ1_9ZZZZ